MAYSGETVTIPLGAYGLLTDVAPGNIPANALIKADNVVCNIGSIEKIGGSLKYNSSALSDKIVALFDWHPTNWQQRLIAACADGTIYRDIGDRTFSGGTAINSGLSGLTNRCQFVEGGKEGLSNAKKLFLFSENNQVQVLSGDGTAFADITSPAADWTAPNFPTCGIVHRNRLWAFLKQRAYASDATDHEDFTGGGILTMNVGAGEGGDIVGAYVFKGRMFVFKEGNFTYYLDDTDTTSSNWVFRKLDTGIGLASPHSIVQMINDLIFMNTTGSLSSGIASQNFGDMESADVLANAQIEDYVRSVTSVSGLQYSHALYYEAKKQAYFTYWSTYNGSNDKFLVVDMNTPNPRFTFCTKDNPECLASRKDNNGVLRPIYGDPSGFVYWMDREDRDVGGSAYTGTFQTPHIDFRHLDPRLANKEKHFDWLSIEFVPEGAWDISVDVYIDGKFRETLTFSMKNRSDGMDSFTLDTDLLGREDAQTSPSKQLHGTGRRISLKFYNAGLRQSFKIASFTVGFRVAGENATRI